MKCNDRIISVDDIDMRDAAIERVQDAVKGAPGSSVKLLVARAGSPIPAAFCTFGNRFDFLY